MASMRESDTGLWLHNKLGAADELWAPPSIAALLSAAVVDNVRLCFPGLSSPVKLKLLLGTLHLPRRTVDEMKGALADILRLASLDSDPWVLMVADILKPFPDSGALNVALAARNPGVQELLGELREKVGECEAAAMLPLECRYLNKSALATQAGPLAPPVKHFQLKRKPKSATLRAELLHKSGEAAQQLRRGAGVPFLAKGRGLRRKLDTSTPLKGIPKQAPCRAAAAAAAAPGGRAPLPPSRTPQRKERGVKLLDISELDAVGAGREAKRRRKAAEPEGAERPAKEEAAPAAAAAPAENATPDYAAGLVATPKLGALVAGEPPPLPSTSYLPAAPSGLPAAAYAPGPPEAPPAAAPAREAGRVPEEPGAPSPALQAPFKPRAAVGSGGQSQAAAVAVAVAVAAPTPAVPGAPLTPAAPAAQVLAVPVVASQAQPKKNLSLTREQMFAAQEMFKTANKVTRPEKALILGFMAGSRENPCQEQGDVIQIKLSEHTEDLPKADGQGSTTMLVDTVFEMNYATGQWTRFKKYKPMTNAP